MFIRILGEPIRSYFAFNSSMSPHLKALESGSCQCGTTVIRNCSVVPCCCCTVWTVPVSVWAPGDCSTASPCLAPTWIPWWLAAGQTTPGALGPSWPCWLQPWLDNSGSFLFHRSQKESRICAARPEAPGWGWDSLLCPPELQPHPAASPCPAGWGCERSR